MPSSTCQAIEPDVPVSKESIRSENVALRQQIKSAILNIQRLSENADRVLRQCQRAYEQLGELESD
jgi:hypothetical protein